MQIETKTDIIRHEKTIIDSCVRLLLLKLYNRCLIPRVAKKNKCRFLELMEDFRQKEMINRRVVIDGIWLTSFQEDNCTYWHTKLIFLEGLALLLLFGEKIKYKPCSKDEQISLCERIFKLESECRWTSFYKFFPI